MRLATALGGGTPIAFIAGMVDAIIRLTVLVVLMLGALNVLHAGAIVARLLQHAARRGGRPLWLPAFQCMADVRAWLGDWRDLLASDTPALIALRHEARVVIGRQIHLAVVSHTWALALTVI
jgi:hypothetical protein